MVQSFTTTSAWSTRCDPTSPRPPGAWANVSRGHIGIMETKMETTVVYRVILGRWKRTWKLLIKIGSLEVPVKGIHAERCPCAHMFMSSHVYIICIYEKEGIVFKKCRE